MCLLDLPILCHSHCLHSRLGSWHDCFLTHIPGSRPASPRFMLLITVTMLLAYSRADNSSQTPTEAHPNCPRFSFISPTHIMLLKPTIHSQPKTISQIFLRLRICMTVSLPIQIPLTLKIKFSTPLCYRVPAFNCLIH